MIRPLWRWAIDSVENGRRNHRLASPQKGGSCAILLYIQRNCPWGAGEAHLLLFQPLRLLAAGKGSHKWPAGETARRPSAAIVVDWERMVRGMGERQCRKEERGQKCCLGACCSSMFLPGLLRSWSVSLGTVQHGRYRSVPIHPGAGLQSALRPVGGVLSMRARKRKEPPGS